MNPGDFLHLEVVSRLTRGSKIEASTAGPCDVLFLTREAGAVGDGVPQRHLRVCAQDMPPDKRHIEPNSNICSDLVAGLGLVLPCSCHEHRHLPRSLGHETPQTRGVDSILYP